jgi:hypothetical protein
MWWLGAAVASTSGEALAQASLDPSTGGLGRPKPGLGIKFVNPATGQVRLLPGTPRPFIPPRQLPDGTLLIEEHPANDGRQGPLCGRPGLPRCQ